MQRIIFGLVKVVVTRSLGSDAFVKSPYLESTARLLLEKIQAMPIWLRYPMMMLTYLFDLIGVVSTGHRFQTQPYDQQAKSVIVWKNSGVKLCREFIKFYEKLALFIYFSL